MNGLMSEVVGAISIFYGLKNDFFSYFSITCFIRFIIPPFPHFKSCLIRITCIFLPFLLSTQILIHLFSPPTSSAIFSFIFHSNRFPIRILIHTPVIPPYIFPPSPQYLSTLTSISLHPHLNISPTSPQYLSTLTSISLHPHLNISPPSPQYLSTLTSISLLSHLNISPPSPQYLSTLTSISLHSHLNISPPSPQYLSTLTSISLHPHLNISPPSPQYLSTLTSISLHPHFHTSFHLCQSLIISENCHI